MLNLAEYIIIARNSGESNARIPPGDGPKETAIRCPEGSSPGKPEGRRPNDRLIRIWGIVSEEDEGRGFQLVLDDDWFLRLQCRGKTVALFDPHDYTLPELSAKVTAIIRIVRRNPFLIGDGSFFWSEN